MNDFENLKNAVNSDQTATAAIFGAAIYFIRTMLRRGIKDMAEVKGELSQSEYVEILRKDLEMLRKENKLCVQERNNATERISALEAEIKVLRECLTCRNVI